MKRIFELTTIILLFFGSFSLTLGGEFESLRGDYTLPEATVTTVTGTKGIADGTLTIPISATLQINPDSTLEFNYIIHNLGTVLVSQSNGVIRKGEISGGILPYFVEDFNDLDLEGWVHTQEDNGDVIGIENDTHHSYYKITAKDGYFDFYEGDFICLDVAHDVDIPAGLTKLTLEFDTALAGTWAYNGFINLFDGERKCVFGGGISRSGYAVYKGLWPWESKISIDYLGIPGTPSWSTFDEYTQPYQIAPNKWNHIKVTFNKVTINGVDNGELTLTANYVDQNGQPRTATLTQTVNDTTLPAVKYIQIYGWQHTKGAKFDNIIIY